MTFKSGTPNLRDAIMAGPRIFTRVVRIFAPLVCTASLVALAEAGDTSKTNLYKASATHNQFGQATISTRDAATGMPTGRRMHKPRDITKEVPPPSPAPVPIPYPNTGRSAGEIGHAGSPLSAGPLGGTRLSVPSKLR
jgi:hypothetical protein